MREQQNSREIPTADIKQLLRGFLITLISVGMLLGSFLLTQLDTAGGPSRPTQVVAHQPTLITPFLPTLSPTPVVTEEGAPSSPTSAPSPTESSPLMPSCPRPSGWVVYTVQEGDTLASLAWQADTTTLILMQANCLNRSAIQAGQQIYLPPTFYASPTPRPYRCGPPFDWVTYSVQPGDTLFSLSRRTHVGIEAIRRANCLSGYTIYVGQVLYLPSLPPTPTHRPSPTPIPTLFPSPSPTPIPTATRPPSPIDTPTSPPAPTSTATSSSTISPSPTLTISATHTPLPSPTGGTATPTFTPLPDTPTPTSTVNPGTGTLPATLSPTATSTPQPTLTATSTPQPTSTPTSTESPTATPTLSPTPG